MKLKNLLRFLKIEFKRQLQNDVINKFYFFTVILWPVTSFCQLLFNISYFPIEKLSFLPISDNQNLYYYVFIGYIAFIIFSSGVQSSWNIGFEKQQGTLSTIFMTPVSRELWIYSRAASAIFSNSFIYIILFFAMNLFYKDFSTSTIVLSLIVIMISSIIWCALLMSFFVVLRDGTILYVLLEGPQETLSGLKAPISISPKIVKIFSSIIPLTYTIEVVRLIMFKGKVDIGIFSLYLLVNIILIVVTLLSLKVGENYLRKTGNFEIY